MKNLLSVKNDINDGIITLFGRFGLGKMGKTKYEVRGNKYIPLRARLENQAVRIFFIKYGKTEIGI